MRRALGRAAILLGTTLLGVLVLELALRLLAPANPFSPDLPLRPYVKMKMHVELRGVTPDVFYSTNRWGFRGEEPPPRWEDAYTILAIGGSTTQCFYLDDQKTWPALLQQNLREFLPSAWVGNAGIDGHSTRGHLVLMKTAVARLKPRMAIFLVGVNDLALSLAEQQGIEQSPHERTDWRSKLFGVSRLLQVLYAWKQAALDEVLVVNKTGHGNYVPAPLIRPGKLPEQLADCLPQLPEYERNLREMIRLGRQGGVRMVFLTQPMLFDDADRWQRVVGFLYWVRKARFDLSAATCARLLALYNDALERVCREEHVECIDLAAAIPHDEEYFYDAAHLTERGAALVARVVADYLRANPPQPVAPANR